MQDVLFMEAAQRYLEAYREIEGANLRSVYLWGSVFRQEAIPGFSDLDLHAFVHASSPTEPYNPMRERLDQEMPGVEGFSRPMLAYTVAKHDFIAFRLKWDARLLYGEDLLAGKQLLPADRAMAQQLFPAVRDLAWFAAGRLTTNPTDFALPDDEAARYRKLARLGILGGAYLLMAQGLFQSYRGNDVLPLLRTSIPEWMPFLDRTQAAYIAPIAAASANEEGYTQELAEFLTWVDVEIGQEV